MDWNRLCELVSLLRNKQLRNQVGLWLLPAELWGQEPEEAARLVIGSIDLRQQLLASLPSGTRFAGLSFARIIELLDAVCSQPFGMDCQLIYNFDLLLARLTHQDRQEIWTQLHQGFPYRSRSLLITMPDTATNLLPSRQQLMIWQQDERLVGFIR